MSHANAPLTPAGRLRLVQRCQSRPIAHVAAEAGVSRQCLSKWVHRWRADGEDGLHDRSSRPTVNPTATPTAVVERIVAMRKRKWSARRIALELRSEDVTIAVCTGNDTLVWPHRDGLFWTRVRHSGAVVTV